MDTFTIIVMVIMSAHIGACVYYVGQEWRGE